VCLRCASHTRAPRCASTWCLISTWSDLNLVLTTQVMLNTVLTLCYNLGRQRRRLARDMQDWFFVCLFVCFGSGAPRSLASCSGGVGPPSVPGRDRKAPRGKTRRGGSREKVMCQIHVHTRMHARIHTQHTRVRTHTHTCACSGVGYVAVCIWMHRMCR
jgi:hypothetical protein